MSKLLYREDVDAVKKRMALWWQDGDIGRPAMLLTAPRSKPPAFPSRPQPENWISDSAPREADYRAWVAERNCAQTGYFGEALPAGSAYIGANSLALFLGCRAVEQPDTIWFEPCLDAPETDRLVYDPANYYWQFTQELTRELRRAGQGKFLLEFPDLIEGLDTLAALRGNENMLLDLADRPEWARQALRRITDLYFRYYDPLYDLVRDENGGSIYWFWAPGRMAKFQCDFSAMISPAMFKEFMAPLLAEMCERVSYSMYHWDGPGALGHHDAILALPGLKVLQWTAGAGHEPADHPRWWPLFHKTFEAGKKIYIDCASIESLKALRREFGPKLKRFILGHGCRTPAEAAQMLQAAEV